MAALNMNDVSTGALTKVASQIWHITDEVTATIEATGYYNNLAIDSKVGAVGILYHIDLAGKVTIYGYTHDGATAGSSAVLTLTAGGAEVALIP